MKVVCNVFLIFLSCLEIAAQELPPIKNFSPSDYNFENQNWSISQSENKLIYIANNKGLLEYNGARWVLYPSPNETIMRSVKVIDDRIYTGCYMEFGYWKKNQLGTLDYYSITEKLQIELKEDEEFWSIEVIDKWLIFQSLSRIYILNTDNNQLRYIDSDKPITKMFKVREDIYFHKQEVGIFKVENNNSRLMIDDEVVKKDDAIGLFELGERLVVLTRNNGFYLYENGGLTKWKTINGEFSEHTLYSAIQLRDGNFVLGTISNGLYHVDIENGVQTVFNQSNGLLNNTVLFVFEDIDGNIWSGLDNGISYINLVAPIQIYKDNGTVGSIYASAIYDNKLYFGSNQGLFFKEMDSDADFNLIPNTQGQVWSLKVIDGTLFCGHHIGTLVVEGTKVRKIEGTYGTWNIKSFPGHENLIIEGNYDGLYVLEKKNAKWVLRNKIDGFNNSSRYFEVLNDQIFVNHEYKGIFTLSVDGDFNRATKIKVDTSLKGANSSLAKYRGEIVYAYKNGIFKYNLVDSVFFMDSVLSRAINRNLYISGRIILDEINDEFWLFNRTQMVNISSKNISDLPKIKYFPMTLEVRKDVVEYENILNIEGSGKYLLGGSSGYIILDFESLVVSDFSVYIQSVSEGLVNHNGRSSKSFVSLGKTGNFDSDHNNLRIRFYSPEYYDYLETHYQYQLEGLYDTWSEWSKDSEAYFENIPSGDYQFKVRAKLGDKVSSNIATYDFTIRKPWFASTYMILLYIVFSIVLIVLIHSLYRRHYRKKHQKLIEKNKREIQLAKLQNEKEIIRIKNEQLVVDYREKSKELAASTISIIKKNELLTQIKESLLKIEDKHAIKPVIKIIDRNISGSESWEMFKEAFNNADSEFFKKIKNKHPDLTPNDLKLCAYLRLNLSSKEIAPMFNISPRSVEIKRYRLRKKLDLKTNDNLTSYILSI